jgi:DUF4097 and DUF4098 domain-containing protein YvlB
MRRRGSLVGPMLIIVIGVWFLLSSLRPDLPLLEIAARYWPFVLVGWGLLRLIEILSWAARGRALPRSGISGGEWMVVVLICMVGSAMWLFSHRGPWRNLAVIANNRLEIFGHTFDYPIEDQRAPAPKGVRLVVENLRGNVRVVGADTQEVTVGGRKSVRALTEADAARAARQSEIEISSIAGQIVVRTNQDRVTGDQRITSDLEMTVPREASLEIRGRYGDFDISNIGGPVEITSDNAGVRLENLGSTIRLNLQRGDVLRASNIKGGIEVVGNGTRELELSAVGGEVTIRTPLTDLRVAKVPGQLHMDPGELTGTNLVGPIRYSTTRRRDVRLEDFTQSLELSLIHGDIALRPGTDPLPKINAQTESGEIELAVPEGAKFSLKATTRRGELNNEFGAVLKTQYDGGNDRMSGSIVGGVELGVPITLQTGRGSITIRKDDGTGLAMPAAPPEPPRPPRAPRPPRRRTLPSEKA